MAKPFTELHNKMSSKAQAKARRLTNKMAKEVKVEKNFNMLIEFRGDQERLADAFEDVIKKLIKYDFIDSIEIGPLNA